MRREGIEEAKGMMRRGDKQTSVTQKLGNFFYTFAPGVETGRPDDALIAGGALRFSAHMDPRDNYDM